MKAFSGLWFPVAVVSMTAAGILGLGGRGPVRHAIPESISLSDTVIYVKDAYKLKRVGNLGEARLDDSLLLAAAADSTAEEQLDTLPKLTARDTIKVPDSLRLIDPFRYKYYVALIDSLTRVIVTDSLRHTSDSLKAMADSMLRRIPPDSTAYIDHLDRARSDSLDWRMIDSIFVADSTAAARAAFLAWYNSLSPRERRKYDMEQALPAKLAEMDSLRKLEERKQEIRDSITEFTPRILETFAITDSMQYKRLIEWTVDQDFHRLDVKVPDTTFNYHFYDYPFFRNDVNASWLGVPGSPVQYYNFFRRESVERVEFYKAQESWSFSPGTIPNYNTKTPHTELAYFGTILASDAKESDNLHILTTQNILPELNITLSYDRFGGGGILESENTDNKTFSARANYLGRKYLAHAGYIYNNIERQENGGVVDTKWIRDTTIEPREIPVALSGASSSITKHTWYLDQQYRIPFEFLKKRKITDSTGVAVADTTSAEIADTLDRNVTTAFIGHSLDWSRYSRKYTDKITNAKGREFYHDVFNYGSQSADSLGTMKLDNKLFLRLQPWGSEGIVSKIDVGAGDQLRHYFDSTSLRPTTHIENSVYVYGGAEGQLSKYMFWDAKAKVNVLGANLGDTEIEANLKFNFYPFRRARTSPISVSARFGSTLLTPDYYQRVINTNHFSWDNDFTKISTTRIQGRIDIPRWKMDAEVGYALLSGNTYYDTLGIVRQNATAMSVVSASLRKEFVLGPVHLDNRVLVQYSSNPEVLPLPLAALNLRWYVQFPIEPGVLEMQIGANAFYNTPWYAPSWNPALGVFHNQERELYSNGPFMDLFINMQWKKCCIFIKYQNLGRGWPMTTKDYFTADRYIYTMDEMEGLKLGIFWPFYFSTDKHMKNAKGSSGGSGGGRSSGMGSSRSSGSSSRSTGRR